VCLTTLLTIYALTGDDLRLMLTEKPADLYFDVMVSFCLLVFTLEICVSCLGKADYWLGFFFYLDVISTVSLVLDLTYVSELMAGGQGRDASSMRSGRTARIGAKAARIIRVLRLVRIIKLYKAYYDRRQEKRRRAREANEGKAPAEDDWGDEEADEEREERSQESQVGKKLSEMTTRRVICLILAMLLVLPQLEKETSDLVPFSAEYGASVVYDNFKTYLGDSSSTIKRDAYQQALLNYIFYHNWFSRGNVGKYCPGYDGGYNPCPGDYYGGLFWVGIRGADAAVVSDIVASAKPSGSTFAEFNSRAMSNLHNVLYTYGTMPAEVEDAMTSGWSSSCSQGGSATLMGFSLLANAVPDTLTHTVACPSELRLSEFSVYVPQVMSVAQFDQWHFEFYFDMRPLAFDEAAFGLITTGFVLVLLLTGSMFFTSDANRLIVHPVEKMIKRVQSIRDNPLSAVRMADEEFKAEEMAKAKARNQRKNILQKLIRDVATCQFFGRVAEEPMETVILEKTIIKLASLLALGFGEAGATIISHNMKGSDMNVNAMVPGTRIDCIIGVCRVSDFSTATEVLQAKIMTFVNQIAEIIHGVAQEFHGAPNKNSGENFLIIWRAHPGGGPEKQVRLSEMSIVAFAKILSALHRSPVIAEYRSHPGLLFRLGNRFRVGLSFGVHAGWAIEGAVGSEFKIDASYLSPNVSIATTVEKCTKIYGVSIVVSQSVMESCGDGVRSRCRLIDRVTIKGSTRPMDLYCVDLDINSLPVDNSPPPQIKWTTRNRFRARQFLEQQKSANWSEGVNIAEVFDSDPGIAIMRMLYTVKFFQMFNAGYQNYLQGEWQVARRVLAETKLLLGVEDGPSAAILQFMETPYSFEPPKDWSGVREISQF
ncbi:unnamed protein product, partial [Polarella glacialis]